MCSEIIKCCICYEFNSVKAKKYINEEKHRTVSLNVIRKVYQSIRETIYKYLRFEYLTDKLATENQNQIFSVDESEFTKNAKKENLWVLGIINNQTKEFRLETSAKRDAATMTLFIKNFVDKGNTIITDGWGAYQNLTNEGYQHDVHIHGGGDFGFGLHSTSIIESLWNAIKGKIKNTYRIIPSHNFVSYLREAEWKYKNREKSNDGKIKAFFECCKIFK